LLVSNAVRGEFGLGLSFTLSPTSPARHVINSEQLFRAWWLVIFSGATLLLIA
jgi:hypothetical protein